MTDSFEQVTKYKMTILQIAFSLSVNIYVYVRETKQRSGKVSWKKKPRHRDVTKKKVRRHTKNDSTAGGDGGGERRKGRKVKKSKRRTRKKNR